MAWEDSGKKIVPLVLRPNGFTQPDYNVFVKGDDESIVGRVYYSVGASSDPNARWFWTVYGQYWPNRLPPHGGLAASLDEAKAAFRRCWESASEQA